MRERDFITKNKEQWEELEGLLQEKQVDPAELGELFVKVSDDLSFAQTFYRHRSVRVYLNSLARKIFDALYKRRKMRREGFLRFWAEDLPLMIYEARPAMRLSFWFFFLSVMIGVFSSIHDPDFARYILGDSYIRMTEENIASGDPMAVYQEKDAFGMTAGIAMNNFLVDLLAFFAGIFAGIGSLGILLSNGIMVGAFQYFFIEKGLFWESFLTIWLHGTLEMAGAVVSGAAGLTMGLGLLFPGTLSRMQSFRLSARRGIQLMMGVVPLTLIAAIVEGFFSRYTGAPWFIRGFFILLCLTFVLWYYVYLPRKLGRKKEPEVPEFNRLKDFSLPIQYDKLRFGGTLFVDAFSFLRKHASTVWRGIIGWSVLTPLLFLSGRFIYLLSSGKSIELNNLLAVRMDVVGDSDYTWPSLILQAVALTSLAIPLTKYLYEDIRNYFSSGNALALQPFGSAQGKPFDKAQGKPFDKAYPPAGDRQAQDRPFGKAQDKPFDIAQDKPFGKFSGRFSIGQMVGLLALMGSASFCAYWLEEGVSLFLIVPLLFVSVTAFVIAFEKKDAITALFKTLGIIFARGGFAPFVLLILSMGLIGLFLFLLVNTGLVFFVMDFVTMNFFVEDSDLAMNMAQWVDVVIFNVIFYFFFSLVYVAAGQMYVSVYESQTAAYLRSRIDELGTKVRIRGVERENILEDFLS